MKPTARDFGEDEAYLASGGTFVKPRQKTYEDVERERDVEELREQLKEEQNGQS